jgi:uncharacterized DUF497 family protein
MGSSKIDEQCEETWSHIRRSPFSLPDPNGLVIDDPDHSEDEERFILLGLSYALRLLVVCHVFRSDAVRIISARKATPREATTYRRNR